MKKLTVFLLGACFFLTGCVPSKELTEAEKEEIRKSWEVYYQMQRSGP